ncbi:MAG: UPF0147 family protein [Candidatus Woesearchaeota archaeon]
MGEEQLTAVISMLKELEEDSTVPKHIKTKVANTIKTLETDDCEISIKVSRAMNELESITEDNNMQPHTRMQILSIVSTLEIVP